MTVELTALVLQRAGTRITVRRRASTSGRWVVLCHGAGMDGHMFDPQLDAVPEDCGICVWDARGHGASRLSGPFRYTDMVEDLEALVAMLGAGDLTLAGQAMGGQLVQTYAARHPGAADRLVLIDTADNHAPGRRDRKALTPTGPLVRARPWRWTVRRSASRYGAVPATRAYATVRLERIGQRRMTEVTRSAAAALTPDADYRFDVPVLLLVGARDRLGAIRKEMAAMARKNPVLAELVVLPRAAHNSNQDRPDETNAAIRRFLDRRLV